MKNKRQESHFIKQLAKFNTPEISDALDACGVEGAILGIKPITLGKKLIGPAFTVRYAPYKNKPKKFQNAGNYIDEVPEASVIVIDNQGCSDCTTWGAILTQVALMRRVAGTIIHGAIRDVDFIRKSKYPVYTKEIYMRSGKNRVYKEAHQCELFIGKVIIRPGDIIVGDSNGVVIVPQDYLEIILSKVQNIKKTERAIMNTIRSGTKLIKARQIYRYDQPWLDYPMQGKV